jgi:hypothetical protein
MSTVEEMVMAAKSLPPQQQAELKRRLDALTGAEDNGVSGAGRALHARIHHALYQAGLVSEVNPPVKQRRERAPLIAIKGQPLSETIIEDRR